MAADGFKEIAIVFGHFEKHVLPPRLTSVAIACSPRLYNSIPPHGEDSRMTKRWLGVVVSGDRVTLVDAQIPDNGAITINMDRHIRLQQGDKADA